MYKMREVTGFIVIPFSFKTMSKTSTDALNYAKSIFNDNEIVRMEATMESRLGKEHLLIADNIQFKWEKEPNSF